MAAVLGFVVEPRVLERDRGLVGEGLEQSHGIVVEETPDSVGHGDGADGAVLHE